MNDSKTFSIDVKFIIMTGAKFIENLPILTKIGIKSGNLCDFMARVQIFRHMRQIGIGVKAWLFIIFIQLKMKRKNNKNGLKQTRDVMIMVDF